MVPVPVVAASLLIGGVANSAPLGADQQSTQAIAPTTMTTALTVPSVSPVAKGYPSDADRGGHAGDGGTVQFKDG